MVCTEITKAIDWAKQSTGQDIFPVTAYFMKHCGILTAPNTPQVGDGRDYCWYAVGKVVLNAAGHLIGDLQLYMNGGASNPTEAIQIKPDVTVGVDIFPDGTVTYQQKTHNKPVGGMSPIKVTTTCVGGVLLTGINQNEIITIGVRRDDENNLNLIPK
ncbi:MAG: hypothetical protein HC877_15265 [Thioploca sp.]|nr:hypothetical protein [Thioploca sp.]